MQVAPTLDRHHQEQMLDEVIRLMQAGDAKTQGLFWIDPKAVGSVQDFLLKNHVIAKPVDIAAAYDADFLKSIPLADRLP